MPCFRHSSPADIPAACSFKTLMICSSVNLLLRIVRLLRGEQNPNSKSGAFQGSRSHATELSASRRHTKVIGHLHQSGRMFLRLVEIVDATAYTFPQVV